MTPEMFGGVVRALLAAAGGVLVAKGWGDAASWELLSGGAVTVLTAAWSMWQKKSSATK